MAAARDPRVGEPRIGTSFSLREDFYSAMFLYHMKIEYILGSDQDDLPESPKVDAGAKRKSVP